MDYKKLVAENEGVSYIEQSHSFRASYQNSAKNIKRKTKSFAIDKYGLKEAKKEAVKKRLEWEEDFGKPYNTNNNLKTNKRSYENNYIIKDNHFILHIKGKNKDRKLKIDLKYLDKIKKHYWYLNQGNMIPITSIEGEPIYLSKFLFPNNKGVINFKDRNHNNFLEDNITFESTSRYIKPKKYLQTLTAPPGVYYTQNGWRTTYKGHQFTKKDIIGEDIKKEVIAKRYRFENSFDIYPPFVKFKDDGTISFSQNAIRLINYYNNQKIHKLDFDFNRIENEILIKPFKNIKDKKEVINLEFLNSYNNINSKKTVEKVLEINPEVKEEKLFANWDKDRQALVLDLNQKIQKKTG